MNLNNVAKFNPWLKWSLIGLICGWMVALLSFVLVSKVDSPFSNYPILIPAIFGAIVTVTILLVIFYRNRLRPSNTTESHITEEVNPLASANIILVRCNSLNQIVELNQFAELYFGYSEKDVIGKNIVGTLIPEIESTGRDLKRLYRNLIVQPMKNERHECECLNFDRFRTWVSWSHTFRFDSMGELAEIQSIGQDITQLKKIERKLRLTSSVFDYSVEGLMITDVRGRILRINRAFSTITGLNRGSVVGEQLASIGSGPQNKTFFDDLWKKLISEGGWQGEIWHRRQSGELFPAWLNLSSINNKHGETTHYVGMLSDITDKKLSERRIQQLAFFDELTELPNRVLFLDRLGHTLEKASRENLYVPLIYINLNRFKSINDSLGHDKGDLLLQLVARRLRSCIRGSDTIARMGADEFTAIIDPVNNQDEVIRIGTRVSQSILQAMARPFDLEGYEAFISLSIGVVSYPEDGQNPTELLKNADTAVTHAGQRGPNHYLFYEQRMNATAMKRLQMATDLHKALERNEFSLHYQPTLNLKTGKINGCEALIRWHHPRMGSIFPLQFIPLAEETGLILPLGEWIFAEAVRQTKEWQIGGVTPLRIAINLSVHNLRSKELVRFVRTMLEEIQLPAEFVALELTESVFMADAEDIQLVLNELNNTGMQLMIDDFGTGYSSFSRLKELPAQTLKIDRSFIQGIPDDRENSNLVTAMIAMAHSLNMKVIAEGIETEEQLVFLMEQQCDEAQGYLIGKPAPAADFRKLISRTQEPSSVQSKVK